MQETQQEVKDELVGLLEQRRSALLSLFGGNVRKLLQLLGPYLAEISEKKNKREFDALLRHHEEALNEQAFEDLRPDALEQT